MAEERVHRRLAAILAADVVGYSRLMGENEEGTLAALPAARQLFPGRPGLPSHFRLELVHLRAGGCARRATLAAKQPAQRELSATAR